jgi:hypothetical protein
MKYLIPYVLLLLMSGCDKLRIPDKIKSDVDSIGNKWVPDQREGIFTINLSMLSGKKVLIKGETSLAELKNEVIKYFDSSGFEYSDSLQILPDTTQIKKTWGLISVSVCNIKKTPSHSSELLSQAVMGTPVKIFKNKGGWLLIQTPDFYIGWANSSGITEMDEKEIWNWKNSERIIYTAKSGDILFKSGKGQVISDIVSGAILEVTSTYDKYYDVILPDGRHGILKKEDCEDFKQWAGSLIPEPDNLIRFSESLLGSPYIWGGTSTKAFDCSGFVKTIYFTNGIILARDASLQYLHGRLVDYSLSFDSLRKGDLIFFGYKSEGKERITHVGMYIGDTEVIHCSGMVRINSLDSTRANYSEYLKNGMMGARRIIAGGSVKGLERVAVHGWYF